MYIDLPPPEGKTSHQPHHTIKNVVPDLWWLPFMNTHTSRTVVLRCDILCHPNSQVWTAALHTTRHSLYVDMLSLIPVIHDISAKYVELPRSCGNYRLTQITKLWFMSPCWIYLGAVMPVIVTCEYCIQPLWVTYCWIFTPVLLVCDFIVMRLVSRVILLYVVVYTIYTRRWWSVYPCQVVHARIH